MSATEQPAEGEPQGEIILYQTPQGTVRIEVLYESETFWLNQKKIAELFGVGLPTISHHLKEIYASGELQPDRTLRKYERVHTVGRALADPTPGVGKMVEPKSDRQRVLDIVTFSSTRCWLRRGQTMPVRRAWE